MSFVDVYYEKMFSWIVSNSPAQMIGDATEHLSVTFDSTAGTVVSATLANTVEIIVGIEALLQGWLELTFKKDIHSY